MRHGLLLRASLGAVVSLVALSSAETAHAQQAAAQALFEEARHLMSEGKYADACPKFADSQKLDPAPGTLLNLAKCYEKNGQSASAWATFKDAEAVSKKTGHTDWAGIARDRAEALQPKLSRLTIVVPPTSEVDGLQLTRDGSAVAKSEWNMAIPVDPGAHSIEATAPNTHKWTTTVTVDPSAAKASVTIPQLEVERVQPLPSPTAPDRPAGQSSTAPPASSGSGIRAAGYIVAGVGVVGAVVGTVFGLNAKSKNDQALQNCRTSTLCTPEGLSLTADAKSAATRSTIFFAVGGAAIAGGVVMILVAPSSKGTTSSASAWLAPSVGPGAAGMTLQGAW